MDGLSEIAFVCLQGGLEHTVEGNVWHLDQELNLS
jgi:hypothetical protein